MRHVAISVLSLLVLACSKEPPAAREAAIKVVVSFPSFKAGCITVRASDTGNPTANFDADTVEVWDRAESNRVATVAVFRKDDTWGRTLKITANAHERDCSGTVVATDSRDVTLDKAGTTTLELALSAPDGDGDGYVPTASGGTDCNDARSTDNPGRTDEACDGLDNNCKGGIDEGLARTEFYRDGDSDGVGTGPAIAACTAPTGHVARQGDCDDGNANTSPDKTEACNDVDDDCDGLQDEGFSKEWYGDGDSDGYGAQSKRLLSCEAQVAGHVRVTGNNFDCDDEKADVKPGAVERCNDRDDNCVGGADETFLAGTQRKGGSCLNDVCGGVYVCDPVNDTRTACNAQPPRLYYPDVDEDTQGAVGATAQKVCANEALPAGKVANDTDCDDVDPGTRLAAAEVCDGLDNDCDGQLDEGLSCGGVFLEVFDPALGGNGHDWRTVAVEPTDGYPVWIAGLAGKLVVRNAVNAPFVSHSFGDTPANTTHCGDLDWYASWVRPSDGHVFLAGEGGRLAQHTGADCINQSDVPGTEDATGIWGFESGGVTTLYLANDTGKLFTWVPGSVPIERHNNSVASSYKSIHALGPALLLMAGRNTSNRQFITSYVDGNLTADSPHTLSSTVNDNVNALWMGASNLACAVGDGGRVWRWNGATNWTLVPPPAGGTTDFSSVVMPSGTNVAYIVDKGASGKLRRLTQYGWARAPRLLQAGSPPTSIDPDVPLYDIAMTSVGDFWMVGDNGRVYHYPQP